MMTRACKRFVNEQSVDKSTEHAFRHPTMEELIIIFPEAKGILEENLLNLKGELEDLKATGKEKLEKKLNDMWLDPAAFDKKTSGELAIEFYNARVQSIEKEIRNIEFRLSVWPGKNRKFDPGKITQGDIEAAKQYPITDFIKPNSSGFVICPFHNERTASLKIYKESNRFHCYGCALGGDVVDFVMKKYDLDFIEAVKMLLKK